MASPCDLCENDAEPGSDLCNGCAWDVFLDDSEPPPEDEAPPAEAGPRPMGSGHGGAGR